jgi:hypothetical protein
VAWSLKESSDKDNNFITNFNEKIFSGINNLAALEVKIGRLILRNYTNYSFEVVFTNLFEISGFQAFSISTIGD